MIYTSHVVVVQLLSCLWFCNPCTTAHQASLHFTPSLSPRVCSNACPLSCWWNPTIESGGQSIGASASASVFLMTIQGWLNLGLTGLICFLSKGPQESYPAPLFENILGPQRSFSTKDTKVLIIRTPNVPRPFLAIVFEPQKSFGSLVPPILYLAYVY